MVISEFQLALIGAGAAGVIAVWAYNIWQDYRHRRVAEKIFRGAHEDVLIAETPVSEETDIPAFARTPSVRPNQQEALRVEPIIVQPDEEQMTAQVDAGNETTAAPGNAENAVLAANVAKPAEDCLDPMIELGIALPSALPISALHAAWCVANVDVRKRVRWLGRHEGNDKWTEIKDAASSDARHGYIAIQLADRQGVVDKTELNAFCQAAQTIIAAQGEHADIPVLDAVHGDACAVDGLCASVDIQIAIHVVGCNGQAFSGTKLRGLLEASGLQLAADGLFYLFDAEGGCLLSVSNSGAVPFDPEQMRTGSISDITFWLDVPRVDNGGAVFDNMLVIARQIAEVLDGILVDDQRNPLAENVLAGIRAKVIELQSHMAAHGIPAGGRRALRLFA